MSKKEVKSKKLVSLVIASFLISVSGAMAELYECNGVWTNKPCQGAPEKSLNEVKIEPQTKAEEETSKRAYWIKELDLRASMAKSEWDVVVDVFDIQSLCKDVTTPLAKCEESVAQRLNLINDKVSEAKDKNKDDQEDKDRRD